MSLNIRLELRNRIINCHKTYCYYIKRLSYFNILLYREKFQLENVKRLEEEKIKEEIINFPFYEIICSYVNPQGLIINY